jgi:type IV secretory pathway TraG/TraD family ATPase VirD4
MAFTLIPREHESQPFFSDAARHLLYGVMISYIRSGVEWTFADLLRGLSSPERLKAILQRNAVTRSLIARYFYDHRLLSNIMSTIATKMLPFEPIAAAWEHASERMSIEEWFSGDFILILGNSETSRTAIDTINRCVMKRACDINLQRSETLTPETFYIIDELSEAGRFDGLVSLLKKGRSKGASVVISFQSVSGLRDSRMYGPYFTDEILGQIGNRFFGRLECPETAEWASRVFGDQEIEQFTTSRTQSSQGNSTTRNQQIVVRRTVLPAEFMSVPPCNSENGLTGYFMVRARGCFLDNLPGESLFNGALIPPAENVPEFVPRPIDDQYLAAWTKKQRSSFCGVSRERPKMRRVAPKPSLDPLDDMDQL